MRDPGLGVQFFMIEDRNLTVHTYEEQLANEIAARVPSHARLLMAWIDAVALRNALVGLLVKRPRRKDKRGDASVRTRASSGSGEAPSAAQGSAAGTGPAAEVAVDGVPMDVPRPRGGE